MITPGQFDVPGSTPITDPLQLQFMTQGQMGYMPQAQFLTPYQYGNFRSLPTPDVAGYAAQETGLIQNFLTANRGADPFGFLPAYTFNTYNPAINARQQQVVAQRRMEDARALWAPLGMEMATNVGLTMFGGLPGMVASMLIPDWASPTEMVAQRRRSTREIQNLSTSKIFTGADRDQAYGLGFGYQQARGLDRFLRESAADDSLMKEGDWRDILSLGMKYGQFDYANNAEQYKRILKNMRGNMTTMMEIIGSTDFEEIMKDMKRMQDMGAQQQHYMNIARKEQQYARVTGLSHQEMVNTYGQAGALTFQQAGLNAMQGSVTAMSNAALATYLQRTGAIDPTLMAHFGGVSGMAQQMTQASAKAHRNIQDTLLAGMMNDDFTGLAEGLDLVDIVQDPAGMDKLLAGAGRVNTIGKQRRFNVNRHKAYADLQEKYGPEVVEALMAKMAGQRLTGGTGDDALFYGYQALGYSSEEAEARLAMVKSGGIWEMQKQAKEEQRRKAKEEREQRNSPLAKLGRWFESMKEGWGQRVYDMFDRTGLGMSDARAAANLNDSSHNGNMAPTNNNDDYSDSSSRVQGRSADVIRGKYSNKDEQNYLLDVIAHPEKTGNLTAFLETGLEGMKGTTRGKAGISYGKWQMNDEQGSLNNWMAYMANSEDPRGKQIVDSILRAGGATSLSQVDKNTFWKKKEVEDEYKRQVSQNNDFMEENQRSFAMKEHYGGALKQLRNNGYKDIADQVESSNTLKEMLFDISVQHGAGGARELLVEAFKPGMSNRDLLKAVMDARLRRYIKNKGEKEGRKLYNSRVVTAMPMYEGMFDTEEGVTRPSGNGAPAETYVAPSDPTIAGLTSSILQQHTDYAENTLHVGYGLGEKGGTLEAVEKTHRDQSEHKRLMEAGKYYTDCSGWVGESLYKIAKTANESADYQVFDDATLEAFEGMRKGRTSEGIIDWFEDKDRIWKGKEITEDLLREQGTMVIGIDTGEHDYEKGQHRKHGIDHIVMTFVDPATGELMVSESSGSGGVHVSTWKEWSKKNANAKMFAGSMTRFAKTKDGQRNAQAKVTTHQPPQAQAPAQPQVATNQPFEGIEQSTSAGRSKETIDEDSARTLQDAIKERPQVFNQQISDGGYFVGIGATRTHAGTAVNVARDIAMSRVENAKELGEADITAVSDIVKGIQSETNRAETGISEGLIKDIVGQYSGLMSQDYEHFSGALDTKWRVDEYKPWSYENANLSKIQKESPYYNILMELARQGGMSEEDASRWAFENMTNEGMLSTIRRIYAANNGFGHEKEFSEITDKAGILASKANELNNKKSEDRMQAVMEETKKILHGGETGFFESSGFERRYTALVSDKSTTQGALYTRGELAEKIPVIAGLLAELETIDKVLATNTPYKKEYTEQRERIVKALYMLSEAYGIGKEDVDRVLASKGKLKDKLSYYNFEIRRRSAGNLDLSEAQISIATEIGEEWQKDTKGAYSEGALNPQFKERQERIENILKNPDLHARALMKNVRDQGEREQIESIYAITRNYGGMEDEELMYFGDKEKVADWRAKQIIGDFRGNKMSHVADLFEKERAAGRTPTKAAIVEAMHADGKDLNQKHDLVASEYTYGLDQKSKEEAELQAGLGRGGVPMGQLSQATDTALGELPGVLKDLTKVMGEVRDAIAGGNRKAATPGSN